MRIKQIVLHNFGSYEGCNCFDFDCNSPAKRVSVIGGKNGAGKTTLFTAIQVCLYGNYAFGYKTAGKRYLSEIYSLINSRVRIESGKKAYVEIRFQQVDDTDLFDYTIRRSWMWPDNEIIENLSVLQNGTPLGEDEFLSFQNYLIHLIPPDMLKLYFFDGEKIADYFLSDKDVNIRDALMVLSGNDTFDILHEQVKRVFKNADGDHTDAASTYLEAQAETERLRQQVLNLQTEIKDLSESSDELLAEIDRHKKAYAARGGITLDEWTELHNQLKAEEERRERINWQQKAYATDSLPFLMIPNLLDRILPQLQAEKDYQAFCVLRSTIETSNFTKLLENAVQKMGSSSIAADSSRLYETIHDYLLDKKWNEFEPMFGMSADEESQVHSVITRVKAFDASTFSKYQKRISSSIEKSKEIRAKIQSSNLEHFEEYSAQQSAMEEEQKLASLRLEHAHDMLSISIAELEKSETKLRSLRKVFEDQLKSKSVSAVSGRVMLLLENLQDILYSDLIRRVEADVNAKFEQLIRKKGFFTHIYIDPQFTVHILRNEAVGKADLLGLLKAGSITAVKNALGETALQSIYQLAGSSSLPIVKKHIEMIPGDSVELPVEVNKERLSSGEKQIFVMSLYWAMMNQSKNELPFIIDTPFARIDTQHRANITEHFFKDLFGQLIILSTDEELSQNHLKVLQNQMGNVYTLEYGEDKKTTIHKGQYFEV